MKAPDCTTNRLDGGYIKNKAGKVEMSIKDRYTWSSRKTSICVLVVIHFHHLVAALTFFVEAQARLVCRCAIDRHHA